MTRADKYARGPVPTQGGPLELLVVERASASPLATQKKLSRKKTASNVLRKKPLPGNLRELQSWFATVIMHPLSERAGVLTSVQRGDLGLTTIRDLERVVTAGPQCSALERLHIYQYAYHARLIECLVDDFPSLVYALGEPAFEKLARAVITNCPSQTPDLNGYGASLIRYLEETRRACAHQPFIIDLARLEWGMVAVLHAQAAPVLSLAALQRIPAEQWGAVVFTPSATACVVHFNYPVNAFLQAYREDKQPAVPKRRITATAVYRQGYSVWRMDLTRPMAAILAALWSGKSLAVALETLAETTTATEQPAIINQVMTWFSEWVRGGFFASCSVPPMPSARSKETSRRQGRVANKQTQRRK